MMPLTRSIPDRTLAEWMKSALAIAVEGVAKGESPFGASIVQADGTSIARQHNKVRSTNDPSAHAEVLAVKAACQRVGKRSLDGCWLVATAEPCPMCLAASALAGIRHVAFGGPCAVVEQAGFETLDVESRTLAGLFKLELEIRGPILQFDCSALLLNHRKEG